MIEVRDELFDFIFGEKYEGIEDFFNKKGDFIYDETIKYAECTTLGKIGVINHYKELIKLIYSIEKGKLSTNIVKGLYKSLFIIDSYFHKEGRDIKELISYIKNTLINKNGDYGGSYIGSLRRYGYLYLAMELHKKKNRIKSLLKRGGKANFESLEDSILDVAGYLVLTIIDLASNINKALTKQEEFQKYLDSIKDENIFDTISMHIFSNLSYRLEIHNYFRFAIYFYLATEHRNMIAVYIENTDKVKDYINIEINFDDFAGNMKLLSDGILFVNNHIDDILSFIKEKFQYEMQYINNIKQIAKNGGVKI